MDQRRCRSRQRRGSVPPGAPLSRRRAGSAERRGDEGLARPGGKGRPQLLGKAPRQDGPGRQPGRLPCRRPRRQRIAGRRMVFSSNIFLFGFLPLFLIGYYVTPSRFRSWTIVIGSYAFYGWWRADFLILYVAVTVWTYWLGQLVAGTADRQRAKLFCLIGV